MEGLRRRLEEAEATIRAIRDGHVEALVVHAPEGEQIYTLRSADQPYRLMVEQMREGALTLAADGTILYCNQRFADLMARPPERIAGRHPRGFHRQRRPADVAAGDCRGVVSGRRATARVGRHPDAGAAVVDGAAHRRCPYRCRCRHRPDARAHRTGTARVQPPEGRVPGDAVARAPHAAQRHSRLDPHAARRSPQRGGAPARPRADRPQRPRAGAAGQRPRRHVADDDRQAADRARAAAARADPGERARKRAAGGAGQGHHDPHRLGRRRRQRPGRRDPAAAGAVEPAVERRQVHAGRRPHLGRRRRRRYPRPHRGVGYRHRHRRRIPAARVRPLPPGRQRDDTPSRRPRSRPGHRSRSGAAARRRGRGEQRRRRPGRDVRRHAACQRRRSAGAGSTEPLAEGREPERAVGRAAGGSRRQPGPAGPGAAQLRCRGGGVCHRARRVRGARPASARR